MTPPGPTGPAGVASGGLAGAGGLAGGVLDRTKVLAARLRAAQERPYLASALFGMAVVAEPAVPTMAVDRWWRCYVSPRFVDVTPVDELAGVWCHEVAHLLRAHHTRGDALAEHHGRLRVNIAQDCEINDDLGMPLPPGAVTPAGFGLRPGRLFEEYLADLPVHEITHDCGSAAHGVAREWDRGRTGGMGEMEAEALRRDTARQIRAHGRGSVAAGWQRWAAGLLEPRVDWRQLLGGSVREAAAWAMGAVDYSYRRPSRRGAAVPGVVLPSLRRPVPRVAIVVDTSGSMSDELLSDALTEVDGVLRAVGIGGNRVTVLSCDAAVHTVRAVSRAGEVRLAGGGGTDLRVGLDAALAVRPSIVVVLTDGYTPWPAAPIGSARVIVVLLARGAPRPPDWMTTIDAAR